MKQQKLIELLSEQGLELVCSLDKDIICGRINDEREKESLRSCISTVNRKGFMFCFDLRVKPKKREKK